MSIADFLFTPAQQRILAPLLLNPGRKFKLMELVRYAGTGRGGSQEFIQRLLKYGVIKDDNLGNVRQISINSSFPLFAELRSICMKTFGLAERLSEIFKPIVALIDDAFIFGSVAKGSDGPDSDIDLMLIGKVSFLDAMEYIAAAESELGRQIHLNLHTSAEWAKLKGSDPVILQILSAPILKVIDHGSSSGV